VALQRRAIRLNRRISVAATLEDFITAQNISLYRSLLKTETQSGKRRILLQLLETELAKFPEALKRVENTRITDPQ
jgi:hypothetical protein